MDWKENCYDTSRGMSIMEFETEKYHSPYLIDQGHGCRLVQYKAWRVERPRVFGYGMSKDKAIDDLVNHVQPL